MLEEPEALAILANWGQARKYLLSAKLGRGYQKPKPPASSGRLSKGAPKHKQRGKGGSFGFKKKTVTRKSWLKTQKSDKRPVRTKINSIIRKTRCARCCQVCHWAKDCPNPRDAKGQAWLSKHKPRSSARPQGESNFVQNYKGQPQVLTVTPEQFAMLQAQQAPSGPVQRPAIQNGDASNRQTGGSSFFQFDFDTATPPRQYMERNLQQLPVQYQEAYVFAPEAYG